MCLAEFSVYSNLKLYAPTERMVDLPQMTSCGPGPVSLPGAFISCGYFPGGLVGPLMALAQALILLTISTPQWPDRSIVDCGNGATVEPVRHRQTKGAATDMFGLQPPRHISTLSAAKSRFDAIRATDRLVPSNGHSRLYDYTSNAGTEVVGAFSCNSDCWICHCHLDTILRSMASGKPSA